MATNANQLYSEAAGVRNKTGVDPAIIATIAQTESNLGLAPPFTLGITSAAVKGGKGSSGGLLRSPNNYGGTQPSAFWSYSDGAEAAQAFADYVRAYQPALAPFLSNAREFFNPTGPIATSNYYVPTAGESARAGSKDQATYNYYSHWYSVASGFPEDITGSSPASGDPSGGLATNPVTNAIEVASSGPAGLWSGLTTAVGHLTAPGFWWAVLLFAGGLAAIVAGLLMYFHKELAEGARTVARTAVVAA